MPVLIAAFPQCVDIVRALAERLLEDGGEIRCYMEEGDLELTNMGCKIAVGSLDDEVNIQGALTNVHTFVVLLADAAWVEDQGRVRAFSSAAAWAAGENRTPQTILAVPGIRDPASSWSGVWDATEAEFREIRPICVLRTGFIWGSERPLASVASPSDTGTEIPVVTVKDLVSLIAAVDDREETHGIFELAGVPTRMSLSGSHPLLTSRVQIGNSAAEEFGLVLQRPELDSDLFRRA